MSESTSISPLLDVASTVNFDDLQETLLYVSRDRPAQTELEEWLADEINELSVQTASGYIHALELLSLIEFRGNGYRLVQPTGEECYSQGKTALLDALDEELGQVSEIMLLVLNGETTVEVIENRLAATIDDTNVQQQVQSRLDWLEQLSFITVDDNTIELTDDGESVVSGIETTSLRYGFDEDMAVAAVRDRLADVDCYWVNNRTRAEISAGHLEAPDDDEQDHNLTQIDRGAIIFHHYEGTLRGYSSPAEPVINATGPGGETQYRLNIDFQSFADPLPLREVIRELLSNEYLEQDQYPLDNQGIKDRYLTSIPTAVAEYLLDQAAEDSSETYGAVFDGQDLFENKPAIRENVDLVYPDFGRIVNELVTALESGEHVILIGPPGTGKSELATTAAEAYMNSDFKLVTATADWSTFDTIGGYQVARDTQLAFTPGMFLNRFQDDEGNPTNEWLIIDELNRADIDKAFGSLFSALAGDRVTTTFEDDNGHEIEILGSKEGQDEIVQPWKYHIPECWRLLATMNTYDKMSLYDMSYAFMRRFAFVFIDAPTPDQISEYFDEYIKLWDITLEDDEKDALREFWQGIQPHRTLGPAIIEKISHHVENSESGLDEALTSGIAMFVIAQLEGLPEPQQINTVRSLIDEPDVPLNERRFKRFASEYFDIQELEFEEE